MYFVCMVRLFFGMVSHTHTYIYIYIFFFLILDKFILKTKISKRLSYFTNILSGRVTFINSYLRLFMRERERGFV